MKKAPFLGISLLGLALLGFMAGPGLSVEAMQTTTPTPATGGMGPGMMGGQGMMGPGMMWPGMMGPGMMGGQGMWPGMMGPGMMGGQGMWSGMPGGPGMMGGMMGPGMMGGQGMMGPGMMGGMMGVYPATVTPITEADAEQRLVTFVAALGPDVQIAEVMRFASNYYARLVDGNGTGLGEVLVDRYTGAVYPEPGPNMMWNARWGMQAGVGAATQYDEAAAQQLAEQFLAGYLPGATVLEGEAFPGYYTFDFGRGQVESMLSVNAATGEVWVHTWHGPALAEGGEATTTAPESPGGASVTAYDIYFAPTDLTIPANTDTTVTVSNEGVTPHNFSIDALGIGVDIAPGATETVSINAPAGSYEYYCNIPGHKQAGMVGTLTVQ